MLYVGQKAAFRRAKKQERWDSSVISVITKEQVDKKGGKDYVTGKCKAVFRGANQE